MGALIKANLLFIQLILNSVLGLLFQREAARLFSISVEKSIFDIAFTFPFGILEALGLTFLHTILVAHFIKKDSQIQHAQIFYTTILLILITVSPLALVIYYYSNEIATFLAPGMDIIQTETLSQCLKILLPILIIMPLSYVLTARQQGNGDPVGQEFLLMISRFITIGYLSVSSHAHDILDFCYLVTYTILIAFLIQLILHIPFFLNSTIKINKNEISIIFVNVSQFVVLGALAQISATYSRSLLTTADPKLVSVWMYSLYLVEPIGNIFGRVVAFTTGIPLGKESSLQASINMQRLMKYFAQINLVTIPFIAFVFYYLDTIIGTVFGESVFTKDDLNLLKTSVYILMPSVVFSIFKWLMIYPITMSFKGSVLLAFAPGFVIQIIALHFMSDEITLINVASVYVLTLIIQCVCGAILLSSFARISKEN